MPETNPHFETASSWEATRDLVAFRPAEPSDTAGLQLQSLPVHVMDHRRRRLPVKARSLEAHYGAFVLSEGRHSSDAARRLALEVSYGRDAQPAQIAGHEGRMYELGPEPEPGGIDGRPPAVVVWHDAGMLYLVASLSLPAIRLLGIARSCIPDGQSRGSAALAAAATARRSAVPSLWFGATGHPPGHPYPRKEVPMAWQPRPSGPARRGRARSRPMTSRPSPTCPATGTRSISTRASRLARAPAGWSFRAA